MKISLDWLRDFVDLGNESPDELGLKFTMASAEIEGIEDLGANLGKVVTAKILEIFPHPDAEKLQVTKVDNGTEILQVVCGAKNIAVGQVVPLAEVGAVLLGDFKIKVSNKRGVESFGMLCSGIELGINDDSEGIMILPENTPLGLPLKDVTGRNDFIIEIDNKSLTHRPDLWGHYGIAREFSAILKKSFKKLTFDIPEPDEIKSLINVKIENSDLCPRYSALAFDNIKILPSPDWLQKRLINIGSKPINNVVDATNYVMFELGQPMHAFDGRKLKNSTIIIRKARDGEKLTTLDDVERDLTSEMLVIADEDKPIALAGVMGNENSEVDKSTTFVILESANFNPASVRRTALKLGLRTEASARFEKSLDPLMTVQGISRFYQILKETCPEIKIVSKLADVDYSAREPINIEITHDFINKRLGTLIEKDFINDTLKRLGFDVEEYETGHFLLKVPSFRSTKDISIPEDIVEEIGRVFGYDNIEQVPPKLDVKPLREEPVHVLRKELRNIFSNGFGFREVYNYSFNSISQLEKLELPIENHFKLLNPLSHEQEYLRINLVPNMLEAVNKNIRNFNSFNLYEIGKIFTNEDNDEFLCAFCVNKKNTEPLFYESKGYVQALFEKLGITDYYFRLPDENDKLESYFHPSRTTFFVQRKLIFGVVTEIHPKILQKFDISAGISLIYLDIKSILNANRKKDKFRELPKYPHVPFDISLLADKKAHVSDVQRIIEKVDKQLIRDIELFDIYEGKNLPENKKSLAFTINFYSRERTLEPREIKDLQNKIMDTLNQKGYEVRG